MVKSLAKVSLLAVSLMLAQPGHTAPVRDQHWSLLANRLFPTVLQLDKNISASNRGTHGLLALLESRSKRSKDCKRAPKCVLNAALWTDTEIESVVAFAERSLKPAAGHPRTDGNDVGGRTARELRGLNDVLRVYGLGAVPVNPQIDGPIDPVGSAQFNVTVTNALNLAASGSDDPELSLDPSLAMALALLDANNRGEAVAYEPLDTRYNAGPMRRAGAVDWKNYRYTAIIVPGNGPEDPFTVLTPRAKQRIRLAASRFADGVAPFIIVSGGTVHPRGTRINEALEMRDALIERYGIPAEAIVVEPYARYTITNMRNATRRLIALGAPIDREVLIVTDADHIDSIDSPAFKARNAERLGYQPGTVQSRLSPFELMFKPSVESLRLNPGDPLDP